MEGKESRCQACPRCKDMCLIVAPQGNRNQEREPPRSRRELSTRDPSTRSQTGHFPHSMSKCNIYILESFPWFRKAMRPVGAHFPCWYTHTQCQCVRTYARFPPWEPATSLCQLPLILPMWLRAGEALREGVGRSRRSQTTSADSSFTARPSSALSLRGSSPWEQRNWGASSQLPMTHCRHQGMPNPCHSEWPWGQPQLVRTRKE